MIGSSLRRNLVLLYAGEAAAKVLGLWTFGWVGHHVGTAVYGELELAIAIFFVLNLVMESGLGPYGARELAKDPAGASRLAGGIVSLRLGVLAVSLAVLALAAWIAGGPGGALLLAYGLVLVPGPFVLAWVFQARDRMGVVALSSLARQVVLVACVLALVRDPEDALWVPIGDAAGLLAAVLLQQMIFRAGGDTFRLFEARAELARIARECAPFAASAVAWALRIFTPTLALGFFAGPDATGLYASGHRLVVAAHTFVWLYFFNLLPSISRASLEPGRETWRRLIRASTRLVAWIVLPGCTALALAAPAILPALYGEAFASAASVFQLQVWMLAIAFLSGHHRYSLVGFGHAGAEFGASLAGALVAVIGALALGSTGRLDPLSAAALFVAAELATLLAAQVLLALRVEGLALGPLVWRPAAAALIAWIASAKLAPERPIAGAALALGLAAVLFLALEPGAARVFRERRLP